MKYTIREKNESRSFICTVSAPSCPKDGDLICIHKGNDTVDEFIVRSVVHDVHGDSYEINVLVDKVDGVVGEPLYFEMESDMSPLSISRIAYEMYKADWTRENVSKDLLIDSLRFYNCYFNESVTAGIKPIPYDDWVIEIGFNGSAYEKYSEFCGDIYLDAGYIKSLLKDKQLINEYSRDLYNRAKNSLH